MGIDWLINRGADLQNLEDKYNIAWSRVLLYIGQFDLHLHVC